MRALAGGMVILAACLTMAAPNGRREEATSKPAAIPPAFRKFRIPPSSTLRFLASEEGRRYLIATKHPLAAAAVQAFGQPPPGTAPSLPPPEANAPLSMSTAASTCDGNFGARFNLEPRANAVPQNQPSADFLPNRLGAGADLIVQTANDWRGNLTSGVQWDQSVSGYYVHRSATADCSVQFEGGLPAFSYQGNTELGIGNAAVAADPARDAFFIADSRFGSANLGGVGLFRASASRLLNPIACPDGTHGNTQAASCWMATPPAMIFAQSVVGVVGDQPSIAVDERATGGGTVYVSATLYDFNTQVTTVSLVACTGSLNCSPPVPVNGSFAGVGFHSVRVRGDGVVTVSFLNLNVDGTATILLTTCAAATPPSAPVCGQPVIAAQLAHPIASNIFVLNPMVNINLLAFTFPKHAYRAEAGGGFTTFLAYEDCRSPYQYGNPPVTVCVNADVKMITSTDGGRSWSNPVSVDTSPGHHFYPALAADTSTGIVNLAYYGTAGDRFRHEVRVIRNQIAPGGTTVGTAQLVTKVLDPIDGNPQSLGYFQSDAFMGVVARGTGAPGGSRVYWSFDSTSIAGAYQGQPVPEQNNHMAEGKY